MTIQPYNDNLPARVDGEIVQDPLTQEDYERIKQGFRLYRDLLLCKFLRGTGLRLAEALRVTPEHIEHAGLYTTVLVKRGKQRTKGGRKDKWEPLPLHPELAVEVRSYIQGNGVKSGDKVFGITPRRFQQVMEEVSLRQLGHKVHPHQLRGLFVKTFMDRGLSVEITAKLVGHEDPRTTQKHYYELTQQQRWELMRQTPV